MLEPFSEGLAAASLFVNGKKQYGFIDKFENIVIPFIYDYACTFSEGLASVRKDGKYGFLNNLGEVIIPFKFDMVRGFKNGLADVGRFKLKHAFINKKGDFVTPFIYDRYDRFRGSDYSKYRYPWKTLGSPADSESRIKKRRETFNFYEPNLTVVLKDNRFGLLGVVIK